MRETLATRPQEIVVDQTPIHVYMESILDRLQREGPLPFSALFLPPYTRGRLVGLFLAVLELAKGRRVVPEQREPFGEILLAPGIPDDQSPPEPSQAETTTEP
jgi:chromatin segregation and condensation protein Rec8/ScpA/Scc1 (kleisin family)